MVFSHHYSFIFLTTLTYTIAFNVPVLSQLLETVGGAFVAYSFASLPMLYVASRLGLVFPAIAIDLKVAFDSPGRKQ
ncbi:MAG: hypothetical protein GY896_11370 [Gammaproteobacteria bacterium]|nr:hypothetical protein [Gammaproteobacteria bacterium]